jgi:hypothetical protein
MAGMSFKALLKATKINHKRSDSKDIITKKYNYNKNKSINNLYIIEIMYNEVNKK